MLFFNTKILIASSPLISTFAGAYSSFVSASDYNSYRDINVDDDVDGKDLVEFVQPIETYPSASTSKESDLYRVEVYKNGTWVDTHAYQYTRQSKDYRWYYNDHPWVHWTTIGVPKDFQANVRVTRLNRVFNNEPFVSVEILPSRYNITSQWDRSTIEFTIKQNEKVYVRTNDQDFDILFIFANPPKPPVPPGAKYFGPGIHNVGVDYRLQPSEHDVYLDGGVWVVGSINISDATEDIHLMGPGTLSGEFEFWENIKDLPWPDTFPYMMIHTDYTHPFSHSFDLIVEGITIVASPFYNLCPMFLNGSKYIDNLHIISPWTYNTDGLHLGTKGQTSNTFVFNNDDTIMPEYIYNGDMTVSNCVLAGRNPFLIGYGYFLTSDPYRATVSNCDLILQNRYVPFHAEIDGESSDIIVDNQFYENINIDGDVSQLMRLAIEDTSWGSPNPAQGNIRDIFFRNIRVKGRQLYKSVIKGKDAKNRIDNIHFTNLFIDGTKVTNDNCTQYFDIDWDTASVFFEEICEGDFEPDGDVDGSDLAVFAADFGRTDCGIGEECEGDFAHDGDVDGSDLAVFAADFGRTDCP